MIPRRYVLNVLCIYEKMWLNSRDAVLVDAYVVDVESMVVVVVVETDDIVVAFVDTNRIVIVMMVVVVR